MQKASHEPGSHEDITANGSPEYAGFWKRFLASFVDGLLTGVPTLPLYILWLIDGRPVFLLFYYPLSIVLPWLYFALMESSSRQATLGKMALGIIVTDTGGRRVSFARATGRHFGKIVSGLILYIGFLMIAFTERKQGLHDIMAGCLVVRRNGGSIAPQTGLRGGARGPKRTVLVLAVLAVLFVAGGVAAYMTLRPEPSKPDIVASMESLPGAGGASNPKWSPDGTTILYEAWPSIWRIDYDGGNRIHLVEGRFPIWSPDGSRIAFVTENGLEVMNADGGEREILVDLADIVPVAVREDTDVDSPAWSPDGSMIAFALGTFIPNPSDPLETSGRTGTYVSQLWMVNADGSNAEQLTGASTVYARDPVWSPDSRTIAFTLAETDSAPDIWVASIDGGELRQLTDGPEQDFSPSWSPDGSRIAFASGYLPDREEDPEIWVMDADGGNKTRLTSGSASYDNPTWSPDGSLIAFDSTALGPVGNIWIMSADGTEKTKLTNSSRTWFTCEEKCVEFKEPVWSPDGTRLVFINGLRKGDTIWGYDRLWVLELRYGTGELG